MTSSWQRRSAFLVCLVPIVACQAPSATADQPAPSEAALTFSIIGDEPVIAADDYAAAYLLPGAAVVHEDTYHLYPVAFYADPAEAPRVLHLTSDDGTTWAGDPSVSVLEDFGIDLGETGAIPSSAFVADDGTWVMYGGGRLPGGTDPIVWRATAPGPGGPWTAHPEPVLEPDSEGWDSAITDHPSVLPTDDGFLMGYGGAGAAAPNRNRIGMATSTDGLAWTRMAASLKGADDAQALGPSACGIDARSMFEPHLLATNDGHLLVFGVMLEGERDAMEILAATSSDGTHWTCAPGEDALASDDFAGAPSLHSFVAVEDEGATLMLVEVLGEASSALWLVRAGS
jgi:hypothetical protein